MSFFIDINSIPSLNLQMSLASLWIAQYYILMTVKKLISVCVCVCYCQAALSCHKTIFSVSVAFTACSQLRVFYCWLNHIVSVSFIPLYLYTLLMLVYAGIDGADVLSKSLNEFDLTSVFSVGHELCWRLGKENLKTSFFKHKRGLWP